jgi:hypothetical protein
MFLTLDDATPDQDEDPGIGSFHQPGSAAIPPLTDGVPVTSVFVRDALGPDERGLWRGNIQGDVTGFPVEVIVQLGLGLFGDFADPGQPVPRLVSPLLGQVYGSIWVDNTPYFLNADVVGLRVPEPGPASLLGAATLLGLRLRRARHHQQARTGFGKTRDAKGGILPSTPPIDGEG